MSEVSEFFVDRRIHETKCEILSDSGNGCTEKELHFHEADRALIKNLHITSCACMLKFRVSEEDQIVYLNIPVSPALFRRAVYLFPLRPCDLPCWDL